MILNTRNRNVWKFLFLITDNKNMYRTKHTLRIQQMRTFMLKRWNSYSCSYDNCITNIENNDISKNNSKRDYDTPSSYMCARCYYNNYKEHIKKVNKRRNVSASTLITIAHIQIKFDLSFVLRPSLLSRHCSV